MSHPAAVEVTLERATPRDAELLGNLMELYIHDLSAMFPRVTLGDDGRFGYPELGSYVSGSKRRFAFLIRHGGRVAGLVLARRGSPASDDPSVLDIAEFFVLRQFRARAVGRAAATLLWNMLQGTWTVRASSANPEAVRFWRSAVTEYTAATTGGRATEFERTEGATKWIVLSFESPLTD